MRDARNKAVIFIVTGFIVVMLFFPVAANSLWWRQAENSGHTFLFLFISFALYRQLQAIPRLSDARIISLLVLFAGALLGGLTELLQGYFHSLLQRECSAEDFYNDIFGSLAGLSLVAFTHQRNRRDKFFSIVAGFIFLLTGTYPFLQLSWHSMQQYTAMPSVTQLDKSWSKSFVKLHQVKLLSTNIDQGVSWHRIQFNQAKYPGINIIEPVRNWRPYKKLRFDVLSENKDNVELVLRVHDDKHNQNVNDRFNRKIIIAPGLNEISIDLADIKQGPVDRELDLSRVAGVTLFMIDVREITYLNMNHMFLE
ncbi:MAG: hypothetical protein RQ982_10735 [Gammaproteobacteria bacterium]|nr:hypothetical protein [Gammaproteobacteria bacterium]